jgi:hypothetical protein
MTPPFPPDKKELIEELLGEPVLARLGSVNARNGQPHVVPVWFLWDGTALWISAFSSTRKVKDLQSNPKAAVLIEPLKTGRIEAVLLNPGADGTDPEAAEENAALLRGFLPVPVHVLD